MRVAAVVDLAELAIVLASAAALLMAVVLVVLFLEGW